MENNEAFNPVALHPLDAEATALDVTDLNEMVEAGAAGGWTIDGDAQAREDATALKARLHKIIATHVGPGTYEIRS